MRSHRAHEDDLLPAAKGGLRLRPAVDQAALSDVLIAHRPDLMSQGALAYLQRHAGNTAVASLLSTRRALNRRVVQRCTSEGLCGPCAEEQLAQQPETAGGGGEKRKGEPVADDQVKTKGEPAADDQVKTAAAGPASSAVEALGGVPVAFTSTVLAEEPTGEMRTKTKPCRPPGGKIDTRMPQGRSTNAQIGAMSACTWGITAPDDLVVTTTTCEDGAGNWTLRVMGVTSRVRTFSRLLAGQSEATTARSTSANFCAQAHELDVLGTCAGGWYMLAAVKAHERVHVNEWKTSFPTDWPAVKATIEGLTVPKSGATASQKAATAALRSLPAFTNAMSTGATNFPTFWAIPDPNANTDAAERAIVDPRITAICNKARSKKWGPAACAECSARGIV